LVLLPYVYDRADRSAQTKGKQIGLLPLAGYRCCWARASTPLLR
jgi:hypothetical protein